MSDEYYEELYHEVQIQLSEADEEIEKLNDKLKKAEAERERLGEYVCELSGEIESLKSELDESQRESIGVKNFLRRYRYRMKGGVQMQEYIEDVLQGRNGYTNKCVREFAIEQQIKGLVWFEENNLMEDETTTLLLERIDQLRKELESD